MDIMAVFMDFQRLEKIDGEIVVSVLKLFVCRKRKVYTTGESETNKAVMHCLERKVVVLCPGSLQLYLCYFY